MSTTIEIISNASQKRAIEMLIRVLAQTLDIIEPPFWQCVCGIKVKILDDDTTCLCNDIYEQEWTYQENTIENNN